MVGHGKIIPDPTETVSDPTISESAWKSNVIEENTNIQYIQTLYLN
jgi:hypothetical protein